MIVDETEVDLTGNTILRFNRLVIMTTSPSGYVFKGTANLIVMLLSRDMSNYALNCIIASKTDTRRPNDFDKPSLVMTGHVSVN